MPPELSETESHRPAAQLPNDPPIVLETPRMVAQRLSVSVRTLERWVVKGVLDKPVQVNGRNYYRAGVMPRCGPARAKKPAPAPRRYAT